MKFERDTKKIRPDFLLIPDSIILNKKLRPSDKFLYGAIYWFEHLKDGECTAGNPYLAEIAGICAGAVGNGLTRLEKQGYILRFYEDPIKKQNRINIKSLVSFKKHPEKDATPSSNEEGYPHQMMNRIRIYKKEYINKKKTTLSKRVENRGTRPGSGELNAIGDILKNRRK